MLMGINSSQSAYQPSSLREKVPPPPSGPKGVVSLGLINGFWNKVLLASRTINSKIRHNTEGFVWSSPLPPNLSHSTEGGSLFSS